MNIKEMLLAASLIIPDTKSLQRYFLLHPKARMVMSHMEDYCQENGLPFVVTETVSTYEEDSYILRIHSTHRQGRAFDLSVRGWTDEDIEDFARIFNDYYKSIAAYSESDGEPRLVVTRMHGTGRHLHIQIHIRFAVSQTHLASIRP